MAGGAADRPPDAGCVRALPPPAAGGVRGPAAGRGSVPDRVPDSRAPAGLGSGDPRASAPGPARPGARPPSPPARDDRAGGDPVVGRPVAAPLRDPRVRSAVGRSSRPRAGNGRRGMKVAILAPPWFAVPPSGYGGIEW